MIILIALLFVYHLSLSFYLGRRPGTKDGFDAAFIIGNVIIALMSASYLVTEYLKFVKGY